MTGPLGSCWTGSALVSLCLLIPAAAMAQTAGSAAPRSVAPSTAEADTVAFPITGYQIEGNTLLPQARLDAAVASHVGPKSSFETIQSALESLEKAYLDAGFGSVRVLVPEQDLEAGLVRLVVIEAKLGKVSMDGQKFFSESNIRASVPALVSGAVVNIKHLERNIRVANESAAKQIAVLFRRSEVDGEVDAVIRVADADPLRTALTLDNSGNAATGRLRLGLIVQHANLFDRDHAFSAQFVTSPDHVSKVTILGLGYRMPLYHRGDSADFTLGYSNVDSGRLTTVGGSFDISGSGLTLGARYSQNLLRSGSWEHRISYGLDYREYNNSVLPGGGGASLVPDFIVRPFTLSYSGQSRSAQRDFAASVSWIRNLPMGSRGSTASFNLPGGRAGADASFSMLRFNAQWSERLSPAWSLRTSVAGQYSRDLLLPAEQFGLGGAESIRGFAEREVSSDRGLRLGLELSGPDLGSRTGVSEFRLQPYAFADLGWLRRNGPLAGEIASQAVASMGLGLRGAWGKSATWRLDLGQVLRGTATTPKGNRHLHMQGMWFF